MGECVRYKKVLSILGKGLIIYIGILFFPILVELCYGAGTLLGSQVRLILSCR